MGIIEDIKGRIERLSDAEHAELRTWFVERDHERWDAQIAHDLAGGRLDGLISEAKTARAEGKARVL